MMHLQKKKCNCVLAKCPSRQVGVRQNDFWRNDAKPFFRQCIFFQGFHLKAVSFQQVQWLKIKRLLGGDEGVLKGQCTECYLRTLLFASSSNYLVSCSWSLNWSCPCRLASWMELSSQESSTTDPLSSCCAIQHTEDLCMMRSEELAGVIVNSGLMHWVAKSTFQRQNIFILNDLAFLACLCRLIGLLSRFSNVKKIAHSV